MTTNTNSAQFPWIIVVMGAFMIWGGLRAVTVPAGEYPMPPMHLISMGLDLSMTLLMPVLLIRQLPEVPPGGLKTAGTLVGWSAVMAGLIHLGARFSGNHGWWTGHYMAPVFN
jgi:hypothetical protein